MKSFRVSELTFNNREVIDFHKNKILLISIYFIGIILIAPFYLLFFCVYNILFDNIINDSLYFIRACIDSSGFQKILFVALLMLVTIIHEFVHGIFFYLFTGEKPLIGFKSIYLFAGSPNWYIKKKYYIVIALSPIILITIFGIATLSIIPTSISYLVVISITINAAGSVGDIWISIKLLNKPPESYIIDNGIALSINY